MLGKDYTAEIHAGSDDYSGAQRTGSNFIVKRNGQTLSSVRLNYHQSAGSARCGLVSEPPPAKPVLTFL